MPLKPKIVVLVGMVASGKSTYAQQAARRGAIVVNDDAIVTCLHGGLYGLYSTHLKVLYKSVENHIVGAAVGLGRDVIIDRGVNISIAARRRWIALASAFDVTCDAVVFPNEGALVHAHRRFESDSRGYCIDYWRRTAQSHEARWQEPTIDEGFRHVSTGILDRATMA